MDEVLNFPADTTRGLLRHWPFLEIRQIEAEDALPIQGRSDPDGPAIEFAFYVPPCDIDDPSIAALWLTPCIIQIARDVLHSDLGTNASGHPCVSTRWIAFRAASSASIGECWEEILSCARREGVAFVAEYIAAGLILESGFHTDLMLARAG